MSAIDELGCAVDAALAPVLAEVATEALAAALLGDELPSDPVILAKAIIEAQEKIADAWDILTWGAAELASSGDPTEFDRGRRSVEAITAAARALVDQLEEVA